MRGSHRSMNGDPYWIDSEGKSWTRATFRDGHLLRAVEWANRRYGVVPAQDQWMLRELVERGLDVKFSGSGNSTNKAAIDRFRKEFLERTNLPPDAIRSKDGDRRVFRDSGSGAFTKAREWPLVIVHVSEREDVIEITHSNLGPQTEEILERLSMAELRRIAKAIKSTTDPDSVISPRELIDDITGQLSRMASRHQEFTITVSDEEPVQVAPATTAAEAVMEEEKKGITSHPTVAMFFESGQNAGKMIAGTEALEFAKVLIIEFAREELPEDWKFLLDDPKFHAFVDLFAPLVVHLATTHEVLPLGEKGNAFLGDAAGFAMTGNMFKHGSKVSAIGRRFLQRNAARLAKLRKLSEKLDGIDVEDAGKMLEVVQDFQAMREAVTEEAKETVPLKTVNND
jgi:hypothetical protein